MYAYNQYSRRRPEGWAERRKYFRRLAESDRPQAVKKSRPPSRPSSATHGSLAASRLEIKRLPGLGKLRQLLHPRDLSGGTRALDVIEIPGELEVEPELRLHTQQSFEPQSGVRGYPLLPWMSSFTRGYDTPILWANSLWVIPSGSRNSSSSISPG